MTYAIVCFLKIESSLLDTFVKKYYPGEVIPIHVTVISPFKGNETDEERLINKVKSKLIKFKSFSISLDKTLVTEDNHLFLLVSEGKENIIKLHTTLVNASLPSTDSKYSSFLPHITIGFFGSADGVRNEFKLKDAIRELDLIRIKNGILFDNITIIKQSNPTSEVETVAKIII